MVLSSRAAVRRQGEILYLWIWPCKNYEESKIEREEWITRELDVDEKRVEE